MHVVHGRAQHYAWGHPTEIPEMIGSQPDGQPWAEWWMGTHAIAPSTVDEGQPLSAVAGELPYLLKLMAADQPLSLQTHPDRGQAEEGFEREEREGIAIDAPERIYKDRGAKPELLCALTTFDTLCGFRPVEQTLALLHDIGANDLAECLRDEKLATTVAAIYRRQFDLHSTLQACAAHRSREAALVNELATMYPGDPSVAVTLLLNRVLLSRGEAIFLGPGNLHAYLDGFGVEIMANSDNVIRGGMTVKHIDVQQLLGVLDFDPLPQPRVEAVEVDPGRWRYSTAHTPFVLWRFEIDEDSAMLHQSTGRELLLCVDGRERGVCRYLGPGETFEIAGPATVFRVEEPAQLTAG
jgi:mannose-6-phosphate isomerase